MKGLTRSEEQIMQVLWRLGRGFLKDIVDNYPDPKPHPNTAATLLKILTEKGFVEYEVQGRNNLYRAKVSKTDYAKKTAQQLLKGYFEGSPAKLVSHFIHDNKINLQEIEELLEQIKAAKNKNL